MRYSNKLKNLPENSNLIEFISSTISSKTLSLHLGKLVTLHLIFSCMLSRTACSNSFSPLCVAIL